MKKLSYEAATLAESRELGPLPSTALVNAACRQDLVSFGRKCFHLLSPGAVFHMNWHLCAIAHALEQGSPALLPVLQRGRRLRELMRLARLLAQHCIADQLDFPDCHP